MPRGAYSGGSIAGVGAAPPATQITPPPSSGAPRHGGAGAGAGVMAGTTPAATMGDPSSPEPLRPADLADPARLLRGRPALLPGKITRGGMGTGMPYWGPIFTDDQIWALVDYLWTFQFKESQ